MGRPRKTHCKRGHERTPENVKPDGMCRICYNDAVRLINPSRAEYKRAWADAHPNVGLRANRNYRKTNSLKEAIRHKKYQTDNPEKVSQKSRRWRLANFEKTKAQWHRRRARKLGNGGTFTAAEWVTLKRQYGYRCVACWKTETELRTIGRTLTPDHILPIVKGGRNDIVNIQPLCHGTNGCNNIKNAKYIDYIIS